MAKGTLATVALDRAGVSYRLTEYEYNPGAARVGLQAAQALGADPAQVFKTLMVLADGKLTCAIIAADRELVMKALAAALGAKSAAMMPAADAERVTGYKIGGVSPFGQKRLVPTVIDAAAMDWAEIYLNGGGRGLQVQMAPSDAVAYLGATIAEIAQPVG